MSIPRGEAGREAMASGRTPVEHAGTARPLAALPLSAAPGAAGAQAAAGDPPQLGEGDVEVEQVVGVEDDALRIALAVAHAQLVYEVVGHRAQSSGEIRCSGFARAADRLRTVALDRATPRLACGGGAGG